MFGFVMQAQDKCCWQKLFFQFCSRAANEEEEIAHKLLGEKFQVRIELVAVPENVNY